MAEQTSSSTRRTWIEISAEDAPAAGETGRPPHGGRGLKWFLMVILRPLLMSSSTRRTWIEIFRVE